MKKKLIFISTIAIVGLAIVWACSKENTQNALTDTKPTVELKSKATATIIETSNNTTKSSGRGNGYLLAYQIGHTAADCGSACNSTTTGEKYHLDCQGSGIACTSSLIIGPLNPGYIPPMTKKSTMFSLMELYENSMTMESTFNFPARSFKVIDTENDTEESWLNIPAQILERSTETNTLIFNNLHYSNTPEYSNE